MPPSSITSRTNEVLCSVFSSTPALTYLHLSADFVTLTPSLADCIVKCLPNLKTLTLHLSDIDASSLASIIRSCKSISKLDISGCGNGDPSGPLDLAQALESSASLRELSLSSSSVVNEDHGTFLQSLSLLTISDVPESAAEETSKSLNVFSIDSRNDSVKKTYITKSEVFVVPPLSLIKLKLRDLRLQGCLLKSFLSSSTTRNLQSLSLVGLELTDCDNLLIHIDHDDILTCGDVKQQQDCIFAPTSMLSLKVDEKLLSATSLHYLRSKVKYLRVVNATSAFPAMVENIQLPSLVNLELLLCYKDGKNDSEEALSWWLPFYSDAKKRFPKLDLRLGDESWEREKKISATRQTEDHRAAVFKYEDGMLIAGFGSAAYNLNDDD